ncbi:MAG: S8 family serine peptidase [Candidatus Omnitrophica bacterium]|nr:S8 family serine peptidase [Candidatus Omnitrophota bacterium]
MSAWIRTGMWAGTAIFLWFTWQPSSLPRFESVRFETPAAVEEDSTAWRGSSLPKTIGLTPVTDQVPGSGRRQHLTGTVGGGAPGLAVGPGIQSQFTNRDSGEIRGRRVPELTLFSELGGPGLAARAVPLPEANTLAHLNYRERRFGRLQTASGGTVLFNPEVIIVKFKGQRHVAALRVEPGREWAAVHAIAGRRDVEFSELDEFEQRASTPNDPLLSQQWHHQKIGSYLAWDKCPGRSNILIAIVDTPFQMDHPDLAPHTRSGWDVVENEPVNASQGLEHSTLGAGMAAAVIGNAIGIAGAANCGILPININGALSEMYDAVIWAADHGVRVVNISWSGGDSDTVNAAGAYLKTRARGILVMAGGNLGANQFRTNQPDIYCVSMTDAADNMRSLPGPQVDFAAPGWDVFSTTTNNGYTYGSGTSLAAPLVAGVAALLFSINPTLGPDEVIDLLKSTALDKGPPGCDRWYGWGRINFGAAAAAAVATLPRIAGVDHANSQVIVSTEFHSGLTYSLWRTSTLPGEPWIQVTNAALSFDGNRVLFRDALSPNASERPQFYRIGVSVP